MELLCIWLGEIKDKSDSLVFENQRFKFTSEFDIDFNSETKELIIKKNNNYCADFYKVNPDFKAPFNLTCIVGENGAGKTCLLELLINILINNKLDSTDSILHYYKQYFIAWRINKDEINYYKYGIKLKKLNLEDYKFNCSTLKNLILNNKIIFYSNTFGNFDFIKFMGINKSSFFDISSKALFLYPDYNINGYVKSNEKYIDYRNSELNKIIRLYFEANYLSILTSCLNRFNLHRNIFKITPRNCNFERLISLYSKNQLLSNYIREVYYYIEKKLQSKNKFEIKLRWYFVKIYLFVCLFHFYELLKNKISDISSFMESILKGVKIKNNCSPENFINNFLQFILKIMSTSPDFFVDNNNFNLIENLKLYNVEFFKRVRLLISYSENLEGSGYEIVLNMKSFDTVRRKKVLKHLSSFLNIYSLLQNSLEDDCGEFLHLSFQPRFSYGEYTLMSLFSRILHLINHNNDFKEVIRNKENSLFIMIDEGELGYHPQWCKQYITILLSFVQTIFKAYKVPIYLYLTSNNPVILSDILPGDVIYLKNKNSLNDVDRPKSAFGANILDLYSDSFFIQDGLIGSFAKEKIRQVINFIKHNNQDCKELIYKKQDYDVISKEECEFIINNIGDSNIKAFLKGLFDGKVRRKEL